MRGGDVCSLGEGGVGVLVGWGGKSGCAGSANGDSGKNSSNVRCPLDGEREDSDVGGDDVGEL
jgi:hypothetical protein